MKTQRRLGSGPRGYALPLEQSKYKAEEGESSLCRSLGVKWEPTGQYVRDGLQDRKDQFMQRRRRPEQVVDVREVGFGMYY